MPLFILDEELNTKENLKVTQIFELLRTILRQEFQIHFTSYKLCFLSI